MKKYLSLVTFSHTIFALPFSIIGFFLGIQQYNASFSILKFILMLVCMVCARNSAMAFNRFLDREIDAKNPRTKNRDIPSGRISSNEAMIFTIVNSILFVLATYFINPICFYLSPIALIIVLGYSYTKRFTALCHLVLGLGLSLAPIGAYLVVTGFFNFVPLCYSFAVLFWVSGFDIIYALQDQDFDKAENLHSIPSFFGTNKSLIISNIFHVLSAIFIILPIFYMNFSWAYYVGAIIFIGLLIYQHIIIKPTDLSKINIAFMTTNGFASVIFAAFFLLDNYIKTL